MREEASNRSGGVSRREFLRGLGLSGIALGAIGGLTGCSSVTQTGSTFTAPGVQKTGYQYASEAEGGEWHHCACQRNCFDTCMMKVRTVGGRVVEVRGDENSPYTAGGLCVKTQSYVDWCYREDRILYPLRRTGEKGPGCTFERISWDEAIEEITTKWHDIIDTYGGEAITYSRYQGNQGDRKSVV